ncbi:hypothetical protein JKF63_05079 [Porcisia hertigi]|uniref:Uncharacterized protein n=1 Tax=Porcisia hertigi TaxID=2761500 RepID=A0A836IPT8_9TRYP|nr:hypothetical protein JKF63_05079 [Porcisia hertigi]
MPALPECVLHIAIDADLSLSFDDFLCSSRAKPPSSAGAPTVIPSAVHPPAFSNLPSRTSVRGVRQVNAVSQTVVLHLLSDPSHTDARGEVTSASTCSVPATNTYAVVMLDAQQVPQMLSPATARQCPPHLSGAGPLGWYLDAVVDGLQQEEEERGEMCGSGALSTLTGEDMSGFSTDRRCTTCALPAPRCRTNRGVVHLSLIVVPGATAALGWRNTTNRNITGAEAAALFSAATAWSAARQAMLEVGDVENPLVDRNTSAEGERGRLRVVPVDLDLCATAAHVQQASQMVAALGSKLLKAWLTSSAAVVNSALLSDSKAVQTASRADAVDVRPDTQRKVNPSDFHALYTSMLTEVSSFSERKTMAAAAAFPTMCHLLEYVDSVMALAPAVRDGNGTDDIVVPQMPCAVYSTNFGEHRSWNVLNDAVIEALVTEYER